MPAYFLFFVNPDEIAKQDQCNLIVRTRKNVNNLIVGSVKINMAFN